jgi:hypothetical protein
MAAGDGSRRRSLTGYCRVLPVAFGDTFVAIVTSEVDLDGAFVEQLGGGLVGDFVYFIGAIVK